MGTPGNRFAVLLLSCLFLVSIRAGAEDRGLPENFQAEVGRSYPADWAMAFTGAVTEGLAQASVPPRVLEMIWKSIPPDWIPKDPRAAAGRFLAAAEEADRALRRGVPSARVRTEIRGIWRTMPDKSSGPLLKQENRGGKAVQDMEKGIQRRSDAGVQSIGNGGASAQDTGNGSGDGGTGAGTDGTNTDGSGGGGRNGE